MISRKDVHKKRNRSKIVKLLVATLFLIVIIGGSMHVTFADGDVSSLLTNWFENKKSDSIAEIEEAVTSEQSIQTERLNEALQVAIEEAEQQLNGFTETKKTNSINELQQYTDDLINNIAIDNEDDRNRIARELEAIFQDAINKMEKVNHKENVKHDAAVENGNNEKEIESGNNEEEQPTETTETEKDREEE